eukprot:11333333-Alexandrium_andersonii.AAC.1
MCIRDRLAAPDPPPRPWGPGWHPQTRTRPARLHQPPLDRLRAASPRRPPGRTRLSCRWQRSTGVAALSGPPAGRNPA